VFFSSLSFRCLTIALAAILSLVPSGCTAEKESLLTFAVGGAPAELMVWEEIIDEFCRQSGIQVELLRQPTDSDQRRQGLVIPLKSRQPDPDVFLMDVVWLAQFAASNWLEPLDTLGLEPETGVFFPKVVELVDRWQGHLVALPLYVDGGLLYYRRDLLNKYGFSGPPRTWEELTAQAGRVQAGERKTNPDFFGYVWQGAQYEGLICNFQEVAGSNGGGIFSRNGTIILDTPKNRTALGFLRDLIHRQRLSPPGTYTVMREEEVREVFQQGNALFERNWPYAWPLHQSAGSPVRGRVGIALLPHFPGGKSVSTLGGWHVGISRFSDAGDQALQLVRFLLSYKTQKELALRLGWNPGRRDLYADPDILAELPHFAELRVIFDHLLPRPVLPYYSQVSAVIQRHLNAVLARQATPARALAQAETEVERISSAYRNREGNDARPGSP
jgi:multiple sugar transport system substrate-binding protein